MVHICVWFRRAKDKHLVWFNTNHTKQLYSQDQDMVVSNRMHNYEYEEYRKES